MAKNELMNVTYEVAGEQIKLDYQTVKDYLVNGQGKVTDQEVKMFIELCKAQKLNPFVKDAYLIKYGSQPAQTITSKDVFLKRAEDNPDYDGMKAGIIVDNGEDIVYRNGAFYNKKRETLVGGWAEVYRKSQKEPCRVEVEFDEYAGRKGDGTLNNMWETKGGTMIRKVAQCQALRESFPNALQQLYGAEEMNATETPKVEPKVEKQEVNVDRTLEYNEKRSQLEDMGVDTHDAKFVEYVCSHANVGSIDLANLIVDPDGMARVIDVFGKIIINKTQQAEPVDVEPVEVEIVEGEIVG